MRLESLLHFGLAACALAVTGLAVFSYPSTAEWDALPSPAVEQQVASVMDAAGNRVVCRPYRRIVLCDGAGLAQQLVGMERIAAVSDRGAQIPASAWVFLHTARVQSVSDTNAILALHPDLVVAHLTNQAEHAAADRIRASGSAVFDPGEVADFSGFQKICLSMGALLEARVRAQTIVDNLDRRVRILALHAPVRPTGVRLANSAITAPISARLTAALAMAGFSLQDRSNTNARQVSLTAGDLEDSLGSDLVDVATKLRLGTARP